jgi:hypothetical protein
MNAKQAIQTALQGSQHIVTMFIGDLSDADLLVRPVPSANHIAWQLGHLIVSEQGLGKALPGVAYPELPAGFDTQHNGKNAASDSGFGTKSDYLNFFGKTREATLAALNKLSEADLDKPNTGPVAQFAPTLGALFLLVGNHGLMHAGQFSVVRRKLGKPVLF